MKVVVAFYFILALTGCAVPIKITEPNAFSTSIPSLNSSQEVEIGVSLVSKEEGYKYKALRLLKTVKVKTGYIYKEVGEGQLFINDSYTSTYDLYNSLDNLVYGIAVPKAGGKAITFSKTGTGITFDKSNSNIEYKEMLTPIPKKEYFKQDFIYNGKVGNAIKFTYREYANDLARPAFTQDLQYDLAESNIIGFRGLRIEVISATNIKITYKVLNHFSE